MYCASCGNEISVELKYCNRCGANLTQGMQNVPVMVPVPIKLTAPTLIVGLTILGGLGVIISGARELAGMHVHPAALTWMVLFGMATLFGCTALLLRFCLKLVSLQREARQVETKNPQPALSPPQPSFIPPPQLTPRLDHVPSVTEHTTRTFSPIYKEPKH